MKMWDVVVVGGGPAGSRAAEVVAREGFGVLVLDRKPRIGSPNHCGEGLSQDCLNEIGASDQEEWIVHQVEGSRIHFPNGSWIDFPKRGYSVRRPELDRFLAARAEGTGAVYRCRERVLGIEEEATHWRLSTTAGYVNARYLVGAGGALCPVAHFLSQRAPWIPACQFKFPAREIMGDSEGRRLHFFHDEMYRGGYAWAFNRGEELAVGAGGAGRPLAMVEFLCRQLGIDSSERRIVEGGPITFPRRPHRIVFDKALLCGDAGGFIHPLTKGGIHGAVWSGRLAGECLADVLHKGDRRRLGRFNQAVASHISRSARQLKIPQAFLRFDNRIVNAIGEVMDRRIYTDLPVGNFFKVVMKNLSPHVLWGLGVGIAVQRSYARSESFTW